MKIDIKAKNLDFTPSVRVYIEQKLGSLAHFMTRYGEAVICDVEIERITKHHRKGDVFRAEANLRIPKKMLRAESQAINIRIAIDAVKDKMQTLLKKEQGKSKVLPTY